MASNKWVQHWDIITKLYFGEKEKYYPNQKDKKFNYLSGNYTEVLKFKTRIRGMHLLLNN